MGRKKKKSSTDNQFGVVVNEDGSITKKSPPPVPTHLTRRGRARANRTLPPIVSGPFLIVMCIVSIFYYDVVPSLHCDVPFNLDEEYAREGECIVTWHLTVPGTSISANLDYLYPPVPVSLSQIDGALTTMTGVTKRKGRLDLRLVDGSLIHLQSGYSTYVYEDDGRELDERIKKFKAPSATAKEFDWQWRPGDNWWGVARVIGFASGIGLGGHSIYTWLTKTE